MVSEPNDIFSSCVIEIYCLYGKANIDRKCYWEAQKNVDLVNIREW